VDAEEVLFGPCATSVPASPSGCTKACGDSAGYAELMVRTTESISAFAKHPIGGQLHLLDLRHLPQRQPEFRFRLQMLQRKLNNLRSMLTAAGICSTGAPPKPSTNPERAALPA
jgi:hypothetical protein